MKKFLCAVLILLSSFSGIAQSDAFEQEYQTLIGHLGAESWQPARDLSMSMLTKIENSADMKVEKAVLRYIVIYASAGLLNQKALTKEEALAAAKKFVGMELSMPAHLYDENCHVNCTNLADDLENTLFSGVNNAAGTEIFAFEYVKMKNPVNAKSMAPYTGKMIALSGTLDSASVEGNMFPRYRLELSNGELEVYEN